MKILHLVHNYPPSRGGSQLLFRTLSEGMVEQFGDQVDVFTTNAMKSPGAIPNQLVASGDEIENGVRVQRFEFWQRSLPTMRRVSRVARWLKLPYREYLDPIFAGPLSPQMFAAIQNTDADIIACTSFPFMQMYYPRFTLRRKRPPQVLFGALHLRDSNIPRPMLGAIEAANAYIAFTDFEKNMIVQNGVAPERIHVVGLGVHVDQFTHANGGRIRERYGVGDDLVVGFIGRQAPHKGCDTLIKSMTAVWDRHPRAYLLLAGARTNFSTQLDGLVDALPAERRRRVITENDFTDEEKPDWFAACDVFVTTSSDESFGFVFLEAWATGKPVIGGRIGAVECVIRDGEDGLLVPCGDPPALSAAIVKLLDDEALRLRLGRSGHEKVLANHDWPAVVRNVRAVYERTC